MMPTASAVVGDLIDVVVGRAGLTARALNPWPDDAPLPRLTPDSLVRRRYYLRFTVADRPGVIGAIAQILGEHGISIASVIQHDTGDNEPPDSPVPLVIMTHAAAESEMSGALAKIDSLPVLKAPCVCLGVEE